MGVTACRKNLKNNYYLNLFHLISTQIIILGNCIVVYFEKFVLLGIEELVIFLEYMFENIFDFYLDFLLDFGFLVCLLVRVVFVF